jgi:hypothetical protein
MKRLGQNILALVLLAGFIALPLTVDARVNQIQSLSPCSMSMSKQAAAMGEHCHTSACEQCISCHVCAHCVGNVAVGQDVSVVPVRAGWYFDSYTSSFHSIYPPVDSPPPRHS